MEKSKIIIEVLNDLVRINNDRISGYQHAIKELKLENEDLKSIFDKMIISLWGRFYHRSVVEQDVGA